MCKHERHFYLEIVTGEIFSNNEEFVLCICKFGEGFWGVPRNVVWWAFRKLCVEEWLFNVVQSMYRNARNRVRVNGSFSDDFLVQVGLRRGSVLSPLLSIIMLETISREIRISRRTALSQPAVTCLKLIEARSTRTRCEICSKLTMKIPERCHWRPGIFIVNFEHISHLVLVFLLLILNMQLPAGMLINWP